LSPIDAEYAAYLIYLSFASLETLSQLDTFRPERFYKGAQFAMVSHQNCTVTTEKKIKKISGLNSWPTVLDVQVEPYPKTGCWRLDGNVKQHCNSYTVKQIQWLGVSSIGTGGGLL
jgi:hypothetical protein